MASSDSGAACEHPRGDDEHRERQQHRPDGREDAPPEPGPCRRRAPGPPARGCPPVESTSGSGRRISRPVAHGLDADGVRARPAISGGARARARAAPAARISSRAPAVVHQLPVPLARAGQLGIDALEDEVLHLAPARCRPRRAARAPPPGRRRPRTGGRWRTARTSRGPWGPPPACCRSSCRRTSFCSSSRSAKSGIVLSYDLLIFRPSSPGMVLSPRVVRGDVLGQR